MSPDGSRPDAARPDATPPDVAGPEVDVTVVIPAFRRADRLRGCLTALAAQDYPAQHLEVLVVDDGSPQPLAPVADEFAGRLTVTVHRQDNAGPAVARNTGAARASGALLAFTDDDCEPEPTWVRELVAAHRADPDTMLGGGVVNALPDQTCAEASQLLVSFLYEWFADDRPSRFFASNNLAVPRAAFLDLDGFDTSFPRPGGEDRELCERWRRRGGTLTEVPTAVVRHFHRMGLRGFCRQHWNYGRGAHDLHRRRRAAGEDRVRIEPPRFYAKLVTYPVGRSSARQVLPLVGLMTISQVANAAGFFWEMRRSRR